MRHARALLSLALLCAPAAAQTRVAPVAVPAPVPGLGASLSAAPGALNVAPALALPSPSAALPVSLVAGLNPVLAGALAPAAAAVPVSLAGSAPSARPAARSVAAGARRTTTRIAAVAAGVADLAARAGDLRGASAESAASFGGRVIRLLSGGGRAAALPADIPGEPSDAALRAMAARLLQLALANPDDPAAGERAILEELGRLEAAGVLPQVVAAALKDPRVEAALPKMTEEQKAAYAGKLAGMMSAELRAAGYVPGSKPVEPWAAMGRRQMDLVRAGMPARRAGEPSLLEDPRFQRELAELTGAAFTDANHAKPLIDGERSFAMRDRLLKAAKKSINLMAWAIYDDTTGEQTVDLLLAKRREGVAVRVVVDGQTALEHGRRQLQRLKDGGVEVVLYRDADRPFDGLHLKAVVVDGRLAVAGGMNWGDPYSHRGKGPKWRDTDLLFSGRAVAEVERLFARLWNESVREQALGYALLSKAPAVGRPRGGVSLSVVDQTPASESKVLLGYLKAIHGATRRIHIENAYVITFPALREALLDALARGVEVTILTNSAESVDEPIVSAPILKSLPELMAAGAKVYLKRGDTLHSKFMTVDGIFSTIGSFNLHPRSIRYELEMSVQSLDRRLAARLDRAFAADIAAARLVASPADLQIPDSPLHALVMRYMFNQL